MIIHCHRFGCSKRFEWTGSKTQAEVEREMANHLSECTGHNPMKRG